MGCHALLQGIFLTQGLIFCFLHCRWILIAEPPGKPLKAIVPWQRIITLLNLHGVFGHLPGRGRCLQEITSKKQEQPFSEIRPFSLCCALASGSKGRQSSTMALMLTLRQCLCVLLRRADVSQPSWLSAPKVARSSRTCPVSRWGVGVGCQGCFSKCTSCLLSGFWWPPKP